MSHVSRPYFSQTGRAALDLLNPRIPYIPNKTWAGVAIPLTEEDSDSPAGSSPEDLDVRIRNVWGEKLHKIQNLTNSHLYNKWLEYFTTEKHSFGDVHAWVGAMMSHPTLTDVEISHPFLDPMSYDPQCELTVSLQPWEFKDDGEGNRLMNLASGVALPRRVWDVCANRIIPWSWVCSPTNIKTAFITPQPIVGNTLDPCNEGTHVTKIMSWNGSVSLCRERRQGSQIGRSRYGMLGYKALEFR